MSQQSHVNLLYESNGFPIFQNRVYDSAEEARKCPTGDIRLVENIETGLVYNDAFLPELMSYDSNYQNEQGYSTSFQEHLNTVAKTIQKSMGKSALVEVGCGKGLFLEMLLKLGIDVIGFDPAYEGNNPKIQRHHFGPGLEIEAKGIILRHVLEHIHDPVSFLFSLKEANKGSGLIYIEVPCFEWICQNRTWFDVYYEHVNYFRMIDFCRIFESIVDSGKVFGGQYFYVIADLASLRRPAGSRRERVRFPSNFLEKVNITSSDNQKKTAVWGAASRGVIFTLLKSRIGQKIDIVIDINPAKQDKYIASTGLLVQSPDEGLSNLPVGAIIYVMNSNYLEEIKEMSNHAYKYMRIDHD
ncbi:class I SAM-dependent methyltransferase [Pseudomonadota bacterium]